MQHYVLIDVIGQKKQSVLLVLKNRPIWQAGRLNLCGGKIEEAESVLEAAERELKEETGLYAEHIVEIGTMHSERSIVHCVKAYCFDSLVLQPRPEETEQISWFSLKTAIHDKRLMPTLKCIIPLSRANVNGWAIKNINTEEFNTDQVNFNLIIPTTK